MARQNEVQVNIVVRTEGGKIVAELNNALGDTQDQVEATTQKTGRFSQAMDRFVIGAVERAGQMVTNFAAQIPQALAEMVNLGVQAEAQGVRFERFAGGADQASEYLEAFQSATDNTVTRMDAMQGATKLLQMGLVDTSEDMSLVAAIATKLGDQTQSAGERVNDFALLLANQSVMRLDNFGISSGRVRARIEELQASIEGLSREEAFRIATFEEGQKSLETLGDTTDLNSTKIARFQAAIGDMKQELGLALMEVLAADGAFDDLGGGTESAATNIRDLTEAFVTLVRVGGELDRRFGPAIDKIEAIMALGGIGGTRVEVREDTWLARWGDEIDRWLGLADNQEGQLRELNPEIDRYANAIGEAEEIQRYGASVALPDYNRALGDQARQMDTSRVSTDDYLNAQDGLPPALRRTVDAIEDQQRALEEQEAIQTRIAEQATYNLAQQWRGYEQDRTQTAEDFAQRREEIEQEYTDRLAELQQRGATRYVEIDEEATQRQLAITEARLAEAIEKQAGFNEETSRLERLRMEETIANLQAEASEQRSLLERSQDGILAMRGENVDEMVAEAARQKEESLAQLEEQAAEQERIQRESFGRMLLNTATRFAEMRGVGAEETLRMQIEISKQYGLIDEKTADSAEQWIGALDKWADGATVDLGKVATRLGGFGDTMDTETDDWERQLEEFSQNAQGSLGNAGSAMDTVAGKAFNLRDAINAIPKDTTVTVRINEIKNVIRRESPGANIPEIAAQHGFSGMVGPGYGGPLRILAGEGNVPERVLVQPVTHKTYNMTVNTRATAPTVQMDFRIMEALG